MAIVSDEQVIKVLRQYNPWWRNPLAIKEENKPQKRLAYYEALRMISHKTIRRFAVLSGARRVGKTTIMYQMMNSMIDEGVNPKNILYVSFDNPIVKLVNVETVLSIYESLYPIEGTRYIFLDEIQYTEHWELWMKVIYDSRKDIRLTATGSASPILEKGSTDSGTGRWSILKIPTMSFYEYCRLLQIEEPILPDNLRLTRLVKMSKAELGDLMNRFAPLEVHFNRYLMIGGFPELVLSDDDMYAQRMLRETGCHAVMIGRGAMGNPWIFRDWARNKQGLPPEAVAPGERVDVALEHARLLMEHKGEYIGLREMRKHMAWYLKGLRGSAQVRVKFNTAESYTQMEDILRTYLEKLESGAI